VTEAELEGNRMADRLKTLDKDGDRAISQGEFRTGISALFNRGGNFGGQGKDTRPYRPQRPEAAED
jgi:outer membrane protein assembly factor BamB